MFLFDNPEFLRLVRTKLRPRSLILYTAVALLIYGGILAFTIYIAKDQARWRGGFLLSQVMRNYFFVVAGIQLSAVSLYGLTLAAQNVTLEKERATFDFQRLVAMGPMRLTVGKLMGASAESTYLALLGIPFALAACLGSDLAFSVLLQTQIVVFVFAMAVSAFGLMCSSVVAKTAQATGMVVLLGFPAGTLLSEAGTSGLVTGLWVTASPVYLLKEFNSQSYTFFGDTIQLWGVGVPILFGFLLIAFFWTGMCILITSRRIADAELSFLKPWQGMAAFAILQALLIGSIGARVVFALQVFHTVNLVALVLLAFALTPGAELVRGRVFRAKRDEQWKIVLERTNKLQDSPALRVMFEICGLYIVSSAVHAWLLTTSNPMEGIASHTAMLTLMNSMIAIAVTGLLLYIQVYTEKGTVRIGMVFTLLAFLLPPICVGILTMASDSVKAEHTELVSPVAYIATLEENPRGVPGIKNTGNEATCPALCTVLAIAFILLPALRIRFLLDIEDLIKKRGPAPRGPTLATKLGIK